jgi:hypothetical protein
MRSFLSLTHTHTSTSAAKHFPMSFFYASSMLLVSLHLVPPERGKDAEDSARWRKSQTGARGRLTGSRPCVDYAMLLVRSVDLLRKKSARYRSPGESTNRHMFLLCV